MSLPPVGALVTVIETNGPAVGRTGGDDGRRKDSVLFALGRFGYPRPPSACDTFKRSENIMGTRAEVNGITFGGDNALALVRFRFGASRSPSTDPCPAEITMSSNAIAMDASPSPPLPSVSISSEPFGSSNGVDLNHGNRS
jgi:hypothetical protein